MRLVSHKAFESSGAELAIHGTAHFNTCSSFGVNLALADVQLLSPGLMQGQVAFRFGWFRSDLCYVRLYDLRSAWELRDVNQRQTMHQEGANKSSTGQSPEQPGLSITFGASPAWSRRPDQRSPEVPSNLNLSLRNTRGCPATSGCHDRCVSFGTERQLTRRQRLSRHGGTRSTTALCTHALPRETRKLSLAHRHGPCSSSSGPPLSSWRGGGTCLQLAPHRSTVPGKGPEREGERKAG